MTVGDKKIGLEGGEEKPVGEEGNQEEKLRDEGKRREGERSKGDEVMGAVEEKGCNEFAVKELATKECEDIKGSFDDDEEVIHTPDDLHAETKRKVPCTRVTSNVIVALNFVYCITFTCSFVFYESIRTRHRGFRNYDERNAELKSKERKGVASKQYELVLYRTVTGKMVEHQQHMAATAKLALIAHIMSYLFLRISRDVKKGPRPIDLSPRSP
ncbi:hypothetical protein DVH24_000088 [Malus domestica]|uniref:Uncharacterized protein n=1 Tax=Malus domestica TaxID=3750 RepID=A0A498IYG2_MALDO|nr:hypothetical protein DVH24_000088 [Malus domestica]